MAILNPYLTFPGNCEEAFKFYRSVLGGEFEYLGRFSEIPENQGMIIPKEHKNKIMHVSLPVGHGNSLMGSDTTGEMGPALVIGNNFSVSLGLDSKEETDRIFNGLSKGGNVIMPVGDVFWGSYYGMFTDKFGVNWMVSYTKEENKN
ncbi:VOC family protein [Salinimicrobium flavum]|uniref:VOC family protein n=1 Tax=Salinimicrobium flavum TaxID=1737065 RepID=A0ABW5IXH0_9FLAO